MALFDDIFNKSSIYEMLFFNVKAVLEHPTLEDLEAKNKPLFERWSYLSKTKYKQEIVTPTKTPKIITNVDKQLQLIQNKVYQENAPYYPEFSKIVAITYASLYVKNGEVKRFFKKIATGDEFQTIQIFMDVLTQISREATQSTPLFFPILCGYNIISNDIPLLIKRFMIHRNKFEIDKQLPLLLKKSLSIKPWESGIIDIVNVWKFNGFDYTPLMLIADYLGLKKTTELLPLDELSKYYWDNYEKNSEETIEYVALQSATQTNLVIQLINELRQM